MKKKLCLIMAAGMLLMLTACGSDKKSELYLGEDTDNKVSVSEEIKTSISEESTEASVSVSESENKNEETQIKETESEISYLYSSYYGILSTLRDGKIVRSFEVDSLYPGKFYLDINGEDIIAYGYEKDEASENSKMCLYAINMDTDSIRKIDELNGLKGIDIYNGKIHVAQYISGSVDTKEKCFSTTDYTEVENDNDLYSALSGYSKVTYGNESYYKYTSISRILDENGEVLLVKDGKIYGFDGKNIIERGTLPDGCSPQNYIGLNMFYTTVCNDKEYVYSLRIQDLSENTTIEISDRAMSSVRVSGLDMYFTEKQLSDGGKSEYILKSYNISTKEISTIAKLQKNPGMDSYIPGYNDLVLGEDRLYFLYDNGKDATGWYTVTDNGPVEVDSPEPLKYYDMAEFGWVESICKNSYCPDCNNLLVSCYVEYFQFDSDVMENAAVLNEENKSLAEMTVAEESTVPSYMEDASCEEHGEYYCIYEYEHGVNTIYRLGQDYIVLNTDTYMYSGGAHGMDYTGCYLYNVHTAEAVTFEDLYQGSLEDLKVLIANKTMENYEYYMENEGYNPYFAEKEDLYDAAYDNVEQGNIPVRFGKDALIVSYPPYEMGPYASGYIEFEIPYEEVGLHF